MDPSFWIENWRQGKTGFHQAVVNPALEKFWPALPTGSSVLVPLCGKSLDMLWLEEQGLQVTGVELARQAIEDFCHENELAFSTSRVNGHRCYQLRTRQIRLYEAEFLKFSAGIAAGSFDSLYDRAALVALPPELRKPYVTACRRLLAQQASGMVVSLEYEQELMPGPPFSVAGDEVQRLWRGKISCVESRDVLEELPKARAAGVPSLNEYSWVLQ